MIKLKPKMSVNELQGADVAAGIEIKHLDSLIKAHKAHNLSDSTIHQACKVRADVCKQLGVQLRKYSRTNLNVQLQKLFAKLEHNYKRLGYVVKE